MNPQDLKLPAVSANMFKNIGLTDLGKLLQYENKDGTRARPSLVLHQLCADSAPPGQRRTSLNCAGPTTFENLFDALLPLAMEPRAPAIDRDALELIGVLIKNTTGDIGGRDQTRLFAEIAFDFLDALQAEAAKRRVATEDTP